MSPRRCALLVTTAAGVLGMACVLSYTTARSMTEPWSVATVNATHRVTWSPTGEFVCADNDGGGCRQSPLFATTCPGVPMLCMFACALYAMQLLYRCKLTFCGGGGRRSAVETRRRLRPRQACLTQLLLMFVATILFGWALGAWGSNCQAQWAAAWQAESVLRGEGWFLGVAASVLWFMAASGCVAVDEAVECQLLVGFAGARPHVHPASSPTTIVGDRAASYAIEVSTTEPPSPSSSASFAPLSDSRLLAQS